ncbi:hypothetical protein IFM53868_06349 [Aspergillus udagawae]|uniref:Glycosyl transferase CAP10 domain-containing protein n=1 Tax=Aspergillus udagawae TaxID=91492 RepID=A0ABQ1AZJ4_9EURO|nr:hypothetical protein IFM53868_06349 [Aspergillus udagawae]
MFPFSNVCLPARNLRTVALILALLFVLRSVHISLHNRVADVSVVLRSPSNSSSHHGNAKDKNYSPAAIKRRIQAAQTQSQLLIKNQSRTPEQAVAEYKRRYHRDPPAGFLEWVRFALDHNSKIIDDFDQINRDVAPYRTAEAQQVFQQLQEQRENLPHTRRVEIGNGGMNASQGYMYNDYWERLLAPILPALPNITLYMSTIDEPRVLKKSGSRPDRIEFRERSGQSIEALVKDSCTQVSGELRQHLDDEKDVCKFPEPGKLHGLIQSPATMSYTHSPIPLLSFGRMTAFRDILIPCPCYIGHSLVESETLSFWDKKPVIYWRGSSTGIRASKLSWKQGHRQRFVSFVHSLQNAAKTLGASRYFRGNAQALEDKQILLFKDVFDVHIGRYLQCDNDGDESPCKNMELELGAASFEPEDTTQYYRYLFDLDGNSMSTRFYRLISRQAVVLKQTWFEEWHDDRLIPWAHYIPITMEMEELPALISFLIDDPEGEQLSAEVAHAGSDWSHQVLREIDMSIYLYRLLLELAELYFKEVV